MAFMSLKAGSRTTAIGKEQRADMSLTVRAKVSFTGSTPAATRS